MTVYLRSAIQQLASYAQGTGLFPGGVVVGEPKAPPADLSAALMLGDRYVPELTLTTTIESRDLLLRVYINAFREPPEEIEYDMDHVLADLLTAFAGDFDLSGAGSAQVRAFEPSTFRVRMGYQTVAQTVYRIADVSFSLTVDDSASLVA